MRRNWELIAALLFAGFYVSIWLALPSKNVHSDALDELIRIEAPTIRPLAKHPAAETTAWVMLQGLRKLGYTGNAIRPVQLWNAVWMSLALLGVYLLILRNKGSGAVALGTVVLLGGSHTSLQFALDPFLLYWPPGLALMTFALFAAHRRERCGDLRSDTTGNSEWGRWCLTFLLLLLASLFNPMCAAAIPLAAWVWFRRGPRSRTSLSQAIGLFAAIAILLALLASLQRGALMDGPYGKWSASSVSAALDASYHSVVARAWGGPVGPTRVANFICNLVMVPTLIVLAVCIASGRSRVFQFLPWLVASLATGLFVLWWDAAQQHFWILSIWLLAIGGSLSFRYPLTKPKAAGPGRLGVLGAGLMLGLGPILWVANGGAYVLPAIQPDRDADQARLIGTQFAPHDELVYRVWPDHQVDYFAGRRTHGMLGIFMSRRDGESTFGRLARIVERVHAEGGSTFLELPKESEPWIPATALERTNLDFSEDDFTSIRWGRTIHVAGLSFREIESLP